MFSLRPLRAGLTIGNSLWLARICKRRIAELMLHIIGQRVFRTELDMAELALVLTNEERSSWDLRYRI